MVGIAISSVCLGQVHFFFFVNDVSKKFPKHECNIFNDVGSTGT